MDLIQTITERLGVSETQARGGAGLIFRVARERLGGADFSRLAAAVPGIDGMIAAAPAQGAGGMLGGLMSRLGAGGAGMLAQLAEGFGKLDMDRGRIAAFLPLVLSFVQRQGGDELRGMLERLVQKSGA